VSLTFDGFLSFSPPFLFFSNRAPSRPPMHVVSSAGSLFDVQKGETLVM
jgi:hypothetical protein